MDSRLIKTEKYEKNIAILLLIIGAISVQAQTIYNYQYSSTGNMENRLIQVLKIASEETESFEEIEKEEVFSIYPNPGINQVNISLTENMIEESPVNIGVYNSLGQKVFTSSTQSLLTTINISEYNSGIYCIEVVSQQNRWVKEFIKTN